MISYVRDGVGLSARGISLVLGLGVLVGSSAMAGDGIAGAGRGRKVAHSGVVYHVPGRGTLGYGPPGLYPGFQGFGLGYHRGYGYGGDALGVGAHGGYPFYGGPGYPHAWPRLRRVGGINPFAYHGGPGHPTPAHPNSFAPVGPLVPERPVVTLIPEPGEPDYASGFGCFTGTLPYPENYFAPFAAAAASSGSGGRMSNPWPVPAPDSGSPGN
jgi:hypothetical protein